MATGAAAAASAAKKKDDKKDDKYEPKEKIKDWSELKKLIKDWQQQFREQSSDFRFLVDEARKRELKLSECRQQLASFKRRVLAAEHTQKVVDEKIKKIQQDHMEILEKLGALQSKIKGTEFGVSGHKYSPQQLQDDVGICLLKLGSALAASRCELPLRVHPKSCIDSDEPRMKEQLLKLKGLRDAMNHIDGLLRKLPNSSDTSMWMSRR